MVNNLWDDIKSGKLYRVSLKWQSKLQKLVSVELTTPYELSQTEIENYTNIVMSKLDDKSSKLELKTYVNPEIYGGYIMNIDGQLIDYSWRTQQKRFQDDLFEKD